MPKVFQNNTKVKNHENSVTLLAVAVGTANHQHVEARTACVRSGSRVGGGGRVV
jgi:hypothetical protein